MTAVQCAGVWNNQQQTVHICNITASACSSSVSFKLTERGSTNTQLAEEENVCADTACVNQVTCKEDICQGQVCCKGNLCNQATVEQLLSDGTFLQPKLYTSTDVNRLVLQTDGLLAEASTTLQEYLTARASDGQQFISVTYSAGRKSVRCVKSNRGRTQCFYDVIIQSTSLNQLPATTEHLKSLITDDSASPSPFVSAFSIFNSFCSHGNETLRLGESRMTLCNNTVKGQTSSYNQSCLVKEGWPALSDEDLALCPSRHTDFLEDALKSITKETASNLVKNVSQIVGLGEDTAGRRIPSADVILVTKILKRTLEVASPTKETRDDYMQTFNAMQEVDENSLRAADSSENIVTSLIESIENFTERVELENGSLTLRQSKLTIHSKQMNGDTKGYKFTEIVTSNAGNQVEISLPEEVTSLSVGFEPTRLNFVVYKFNRLFEVLSSEASNSTSPPLNSWIVSAAVGQQVSGLRSPVLITLPHSQQIVGNETSTCAYWHWDSKSWATDGVSKGQGDDNLTTCQSNHLTNFALLLDVNPEDSLPETIHLEILSYITYTGCSISLVGIIITIVTYSWHRKLRKDNPSKILLNLCVALGLLNVVFLTLTNIKEAGVGCKIAAILLHYSMLASFSWMAVEAFYMYIALVLVFSYIKRFMLKVMIIGWGAPVVIVGITIAISRDNYGLVNNDQICWLETNAFYGAVLAPIALVLLVNMVGFVMVVKQLRKAGRRRGSTYSESYHEKRRNVSMQIRGAISVFVLLGLSWALAGFLAIEYNVVFHYLFAIFNSLQGFFLFIFYCVLKRDAQLSWMRTCPCFEYEGGYTSSSSNKLNGASQVTRRTKASSSSMTSSPQPRYSISSVNAKPKASTGKQQWNPFRQRQSYEVYRKDSHSSCIELRKCSVTDDISIPPSHDSVRMPSHLVKRSSGNESYETYQQPDSIDFATISSSSMTAPEANTHPPWSSERPASLNYATEL